MNSFEWEVFKRTGKIDHYLLLKETEVKNFIPPVEFAEEFFEIDDRAFKVTKK